MLLFSFVRSVSQVEEKHQLLCDGLLSYRDWEEMMAERGLSVDHTTIYRWVQQYAPEIEKRCRPHLKTTTDSGRVNETYVKVKDV